jgi:hypothetical protein
MSTMTNSKQSQQRQLEELASCLSETLSLHFPKGPPLHDDKLVKRWLEELAQVTDAPGEVVRLAMQHWKARDPETVITRAPTTSFSLLNQLTAMPKRIFFDEIEAAPSPTERLQLLQQVDHFDDVASDGDKLLSMLFVGLTEGKYCSDYVELHRVWFDQCSSSVEYKSFQFGLCSNVVQALRHHYVRHVHVSDTDGLEFSNPQQHAFSIAQMWHTMWMSARFSFDDTHRMAFDMMGLMRNLGSPTARRFVLVPAHLLALVDPYADWFSHWMRQDVSPGNALNGLLTTGLLHDVLQRCQDQGRVDWKEFPNNAETIVIPEGNHVHVSQLEHVLWVHSLCILRSILVTTRVVLFPWTELLKEAPYISLLETNTPQEEHYSLTVCPNPPVDEVRCVMTCFMTMLQNTSSDTKLTAICCEGIETLLWGLQDEKTFRNILETVLDQLGYRMPALAGADLFSALARIYFSRDWTASEKTQQRLAEFLRKLREHYGLGSIDTEFSDFEETLQVNSKY